VARPPLGSPTTVDSDPTTNQAIDRAVERLVGLYRQLDSLGRLTRAFVATGPALPGKSPPQFDRFLAACDRVAHLGEALEQVRRPEVS
jgi:hypothetical protein